jgi:CRISPR-associated endonuclease Csn1
MFSQRNNPYCEWLSETNIKHNLLNISMMSKKFLGLDLGTNSIGWALIEQNFEEKEGQILGMGSRIIPMSQDILGDFGKGNSVSQTAERTGYRGVRRLRERHLLRRERIHRVLNVLGFLPEHYAAEIDFENRLGKFISETEPKIAYKKVWNKEKGKHVYEFIFQKSFSEMLEDFKVHQPEFIINEKGEQTLIPYDWTIYYLRKKALTKKIEKEELSWLLLNFNQKRGYYQLRGEEEEEENPNKVVEFHSLKVVDVLADETQKGKSEIWYSLILENGWIYRRSSKMPLFDWKDKVKDFIVSTDLNDDGTIKTDKEGKEKRSFRAPGEDDWTLLKKKTEQEIGKSDKTVGAFIYDTLLQNPKQKIKGKLVRTIERQFYKNEIEQILQVQQQFHFELQNEDLYNDCIRELYRNNESHQMVLSKKDFKHLFVEDIIFYQRPLKSKKSSISNCTLEFRKYNDAEGNEKIESLKAIPKSNPLYQEFRLWQWILNLSIFNKNDDSNASQEFLNTIEDYENLFEFLNNRKEVKQETLIKHLLEKKGLKGKLLKNEVSNYRWNFVEDKVYPCNETKAQIESRLSKVKNISKDFLTDEIEQKLWHIIYSVTDKIQFEKALKSFATKHHLDESSFVDNFKKFPPFKSDYGSFSEKAIKKLLPLMRLGKYWNWKSIDEKSKERISKIINAEYDENIKNRVREKAIHLTEENDFQGLQLWLASYIVYGRHSEAASLGKWNSVQDLENYLEEFRQHSLRNPIVEQVVIETLRVVKDVWKYYGKGAKDFFDEIHIELGRDMKNTAEERKRTTNKITENENTNLRIKTLLIELLNDKTIENVRPYSPMQQEALKIYEDGVLNSNAEIPDDIQKISKTALPTSSELHRYKLWLEQKYRSPYTGEIIPLNKLFTTDYEIEHIIPQSRFFDDSFTNKVICEAAVNKRKDKQLGLEFIKNHHGEIVETGKGGKVKIFDEEAYKDFVRQHYEKSRSKRNKLLLEELPEKMIERQMNDTRYISKFISSVLSNIVREENNDDGLNSKNVIPGNGTITSELKQDWGLNDIWNDLILPRFERLNQLTNSTSYTAYNENHQKYLPTVPLELSKGFQKKRIDHRHHALDALIIASATRDHVNFMNNKSALDKKKNKEDREKFRHDLRAKLCNKKYNDHSNENYQWIFKKPWKSFTADAKNQLEKIIVSFKQNLRVINKTSNKYESYKDENGNSRIGKDGKPLKDFIPQSKGDSWAIRKSMHKDTVSGLVKLRRKKEVSLNIALDSLKDIVDKELRIELNSLIKKGYDKKKILKHFKKVNNQWNQKNISKVEIFYWENDNVASRVYLDTTFNKSRIESITDTGIQKVLLNHLEKYEGQKDEKGKEIAPELLAFSSEGIEDMNKNISSLNNGKFHQPILKVRTYEPKGNKFIVGQTRNKKDKYVEAAKGTNLFFAIYQNENGKRNYETIPLNEVIEHQKWRATLSKEEQKNIPLIPIKPEKGKFLFYLSPNDLVYLSTQEEKVSDFSNLSKEENGNIYKVVSFTGNRLYAIPVNVAKSIVDKVEFSQLNKLEFIGKTSIKEVCEKLRINRIGVIDTKKNRINKSEIINIDSIESEIAHPVIDINSTDDIPKTI